MGHDPALTVLLASFFRECPRRARVLPQWDLSLVLMALTRAPFKPLELAAPKYLAWKIFLTLLASGARRSELHAITARGVQHDKKWKSFFLFSPLDFISKTQPRQRGSLFATASFPSSPSPRTGHVERSLSVSSLNSQGLLAKAEGKHNNKELHKNTLWVG